MFAKSMMNVSMIDEIDSSVARLTLKQVPEIKSNNPFPTLGLLRRGLSLDAASFPSTMSKEQLKQHEFEVLFHTKIFSLEIIWTRNFQRQVRRLLAEGLVDSYEKAELTASIQGEGFEREDALIAARECYSLEMALAYLQQECELCMAKVSASEVIIFH